LNATLEAVKNTPKKSSVPKPKQLLLALILGIVVTAIVSCTVCIIRKAKGKNQESEPVQKKKQVTSSFTQSLTQVVTGASPSGPGKLD